MKNLKLFEVTLILEIFQFYRLQKILRSEELSY